MKKALITAGIGLALASPMASALNINFSGSGSIGGSTYFKEINFGSDNAIAQSIRGEAGSTTEATIYAQNAFSFGGTSSDVITYQLILPVTATYDAGLGNVGFVQDFGRASSYKLYLDQSGTNAPNISTGKGYGDLGGDLLAPGQVEIASGEISSIIGGAAGVGPNTFGTAGPIDAIDGTVNGVAVASDAMLGSMALNVNITTQNRAFVVSELTATSLTVDLTVTDFSFQAPFPSVEASDSVVGYSSMFGLDGGGGRVNRISSCISFDKGGFCDAQFQIGSNTTFKDKSVPEPTTVALIGLGLGLFGFSRRMRRRS